MNRRDFLKGILTVPASGALFKVLGEEEKAEAESESMKEPHVGAIGGTRSAHWQPPMVMGITHLSKVIRDCIDIPNGRKRRK